jgi:hypothetical protein
MPHRRFAPFARGRRITRLALALLGLAGLAGCLDEPAHTLTGPEAPVMSTSVGGTWPPGLDPAVRNPPFVVAAGKTYRIWYMLENTAPHTRSFWVAPSDPTGSLEFATLTREYYGLAPGEKRWIHYDFSVKSTAADQDLSFSLGAVDLAGHQNGWAHNILQIRIASALPVVAVEGGEHHVSAAGRPDTISVWIYNPRTSPLGVCFRWLEDEGHTLGDIPQFLYGDHLGVAEARCKTLPAQTGFDTTYVYTYGNWNTRPRQTLQVWNQVNGNEIVHAFRKTTVVPSAPATNRFYAFTQNFTGTLVGPGSPLPLFAFGGAPEHHVDRNYATLSYHQVSGVCTVVPGDMSAFARRNLGETYVVYEEPGQPKANCTMTPQVYADAYRTMLYMIKGVDPSARIGTAYFDQENPAPGTHFVRFADAFWADYLNRFGHRPPIAEWNWILYAEPGAGGIPQPTTLAQWKTQLDTAVSFSLGLSVNRFPGQQKPVGAGIAPMGVGIGFPHQSSVPDWDAWMTGMVDYINSGSIYDPVRGTQSYRDGIAAGYWWVLERWDPNPADPQDCVTTNSCHYRLSDDGVNLNTYGLRWRQLTQ